MADETQNIIFDVLDKKYLEIKKVSDEIWSKPETGWHEEHAHKVLTEFLSKEGFDVEKHFVKDTGFRAIFEASKDKIGDNKKICVNVCFICQYDALPGIGHGAGHNLVTAASIAAAIAVKHSLQEMGTAGKVYLHIHSTLLK